MSSIKMSLNKKYFLAEITITVIIANKTLVMSSLTHCEYVLIPDVQNSFRKFY